MKAAAGFPVIRAEITLVPIERAPAWMRSQSSGYERERGVYRPYDYLKDEQYYTAHPWVYQCVFIIATKIAEIALAYYRDKGAGETEEITDHPAITLLEHPNPFQSGFDLREALITFLELTGNAYVEKYRGPSGRGEVQELWPIRSDRVLVVPAEDGTVMGYLVKIGNQHYPILAENMIHLKYFGPMNDYYGVGPLQAVMTGLVSDLYAMEYNKLFFTNSAVPDGVFSSDDDLDDDDTERLRLQWHESHLGYERSHRVAVLGKGARYQPIGLSQREMEFLALRKMSREEILAVFGVPPVMVGLLEHASYSNAREQEKQFYKVTVTPRLVKLQQALTMGILAEFDEKPFCEFDLTGIEALKEDATMKSALGTQLISGGQWTQNEVRQELWMKDPIAGGDQLYISGGLLPVGTYDGMMSEAARAARQKTLRTSYKRGLARKVLEESVLLLKAPDKEPAKALPAALGKGEPTDPNEAERLEQERRTGEWEAFMKAMNPHVVSYVKKMQLWFKDQKARYIEALEHVLATAEVDAPAPSFSPASALPAREEEEKKLAAYLLPIETALVESAGEGGASLLAQRRRRRRNAPNAKQEGIGFNMLDPQVISFLEVDKSIGLAKVLETETRHVIEVALREGLLGGENARQLMQRIHDAFKTMGLVRANRIARTETTVAFNFGRNAAFEQHHELIEWKEWISSRDADVRPSHEIDGEKRKLDERFSNGLMYPGENGADVAEVVNCRCTLSVIPKGE
jgi:HK97 family phage portal protein